MSRRRLAVRAVLLAVLFAVQPAGAEVRRVEAVGVATLDDGRAAPRAREAAIEAALRQAVWEVARGLAPRLEREPEGSRLRDEIAPRPLDFARRFRIAQEEAPDARTAGGTGSYRVRIEADVYVDRVQARLEAMGLLTAASALPAGSPGHVFLVLEQVPSYAALEALREALVEGAGARSAIPTEFERGRVLLDVETRRGPRDLVAALQAAAPPGLRLVPLEADARGARLRVEGAVEGLPGRLPAEATAGRGRD